jgi:hypothetical protein
MLACRDSRVCEQAAAVADETADARDDEVEWRGGGTCHKNLAVAEVGHLDINTLRVARK